MMTFDFVIDYLENSEDGESMESYMISTEGIKEVAGKIGEGLKKMWIWLKEKVIFLIQKIKSFFIGKNNAVMVPKEAFGLYTHFLAISSTGESFKYGMAIGVMARGGVPNEKLITNIDTIYDKQKDLLNKLNEIKTDEKTKYVKLAISRSKLEGYIKDLNNVIKTWEPIANAAFIAEVKLEDTSAFKAAAHKLITLWGSSITVYTKILNFKPASDETKPEE